MRKCPVGYTCRGIDRAITNIASAKDNIESVQDLLEGLDISDLDKFWKSILLTIKSRLEDAWGYIDIEDELEELRDQNAELREWGEELAKEIAENEEDFQSQISELEKEHTNEIQLLVKKDERLEDIISDLQYTIKVQQDDLTYYEKNEQ